MNKQVPSLGKILVMVGFALLCFVLLLWLWLTFGGPTPMKPKGYRFSVDFGEATQLAKEADVRISGVNVGKVKSLRTNQGNGLSIATVEIKPEFAPIPSDSRATLRQKTILGETYIALTPGNATSKPIPEGGRLARANVSPTVELDEVLRSFDPQTRDALQNWIYQQSVAFKGQGRALSDVLGNLPQFEEDATKLLTTLNEQSAEVKQFVRSTGTVLNAITERDGQLRSLVRGSNRVLGVTARRNRELAATIRALPTFERESAATLRRMSRFARDTDPLVRELVPAARELDPTVRSLAQSAPDLEATLKAITPLEQASRRGLPATVEFLRQLRAFLPELDAPISQLSPAIDGANLYRDDIAALLANATAATNLTDTINGGTERAHILRTLNPIMPEGMSLYTSRLPSNRQNAYALPHTAGTLLQGMSVLDARSCGPDLTYTVDGAGVMPQNVIDTIVSIGLQGGTVKGGPCPQQARYDLNGKITRYPQVQPNTEGLKPGLPVP